MAMLLIRLNMAVSIMSTTRMIIRILCIRCVRLLFLIIIRRRLDAPDCGT